MKLKSFNMHMLILHTIQHPQGSKFRVVVLESGLQPLSKVLISGGGRCNVDAFTMIFVSLFCEFNLKLGNARSFKSHQYNHQGIES